MKNELFYCIEATKKKAEKVQKKKEFLWVMYDVPPEPSK